MKFMQNVGDGEVGLENGAVGGTSEDWVKDFNTSKKTEGLFKIWLTMDAEQLGQPYDILIDQLSLSAELTDNYNTQFWNRLQDEWKKMSSEDANHPWLSEFTDYYDPYKVTTSFRYVNIANNFYAPPFAGVHIRRRESDD